jgi:hypothetical protein
MTAYAPLAEHYEAWAAEMTEDVPIDITLDSGGTISLWWATRNEWLGLIDVTGLEVEGLYGWFDRRPFDEDARESVFVTRPT